MKKLVIVLTLPLLLAGCVKSRDNVERSKEVMVETGSNYVFKKIYVKDKKGFTHEILTSSSGNTLGGVGMLELCVYKEE
jgi:hypothetical protein